MPTKHVIDQPAPRNGAIRLKHYLGLEKRERVNGPHASIKALMRHARGGAGSGRTKAYLRQDRARLGG